MQRELQQLEATGAQVAVLSRGLATEPALCRNPLRMWLLGRDLARTAGEAATGAALKESLTVLYRAGTELLEMHPQLQRTACGPGARAVREQLALAVGRLREQLRGLAPAVAAEYGAWEARLIITPRFHKELPEP